MPFDGTLSGGVGFITDGTTTIAGATQLAFTGATVANGGGGLVNISVTGGGGGGNVTGPSSAAIGNIAFLQRRYRQSDRRQRHRDIVAGLARQRQHLHGRADVQ